MFLVGSGMHERMPEVLNLPPDKEFRDLLVKRVNAAFWEHAETSFIRLASYWDRIGQLLDFVFFGIRQYERDGFPSVMDRIQNNWAAVDPALREMAAWKALGRCAMKPRSAGYLDVEAVEKPLFKPQKPLPYGAIHIAPFVISSIEFRSRRSASADSCLRGSSA
jgi:hypothetical protein